MTTNQITPKQPRESRLLRLLVALIIAALLAGNAQAHIIREVPWNPAAAAYRRATAFLNFVPVRWDLIETELLTGLDLPGLRGATGLELIAGAGTPDEAKLRQVIVERDRDATYLLLTASLSRLIRHNLSEARETLLDDPAAAGAKVRTAEELYRAFGEGYLKAAVPEAFDRIGRAWLELHTSVGSAGIAGGIGAIPSDTAAFEAAQAEVATFLRAEYETGVVPAAGYYPLPASAKEMTFAELPVVPIAGTDLNDQDPLPNQRLNIEWRGIDEADAPLIALGDALFDSPLIFGEPARSLGISCNTCHNEGDINQNFFIPGVSHQRGAADVRGWYFNPYFNDLRLDSLDFPSLRGIRFTAPYGRDGRFPSLREFTRNVIVNEFGGHEPTDLMLNALVLYMFEFDFQPNSLLNDDGTLVDNAPEAAKRGEELFNRPFDAFAGRSCASCHIPDSAFTDNLVHNIGTGLDHVEGFFATPTLLNVAYTAPYLHDGRLETLEEVVVWFNEQFDLELADDEVADLTAYVETVGSADEPWTVFDDENTEFLFAWDELTMFTSTLGSMLIPTQDKFHALQLIEFVAEHFIDDASDLADMNQLPLVYDVVAALEAVGAAIEADDWALAQERFAAYDALVNEYGQVLR